MAKRRKKKSNGKRSAVYRGHSNDELFTMYCEPRAGSHHERCIHVAQALKGALSLKAVKQRAKRHEWEKRFLEVKYEPTTALDKRGKERTKEEIVRDGQGTSFDKIVRTMKEFGSRTLGASSVMVDALCQVIESDTRVLKNLLRKEAEEGRLSLVERTRKEKLIETITSMEKQVREYMKPSSVAQYLKLAGIEMHMGQVAQEIDKAAFTPQAMQEALEKFSGDADNTQSKHIPNLNDLGAEQRMYEQYLGVSMPEIDARKVKDDVNEGNAETEKELLDYTPKLYGVVGEA